MITALSNGTPPLSAAPTPGCLMPLSPLGAPTISPLCNVDTLLGMATTLWPIIHRLAALRALKTDLENAIRAHETPSKIAVLRTEFGSTAQAIETALLKWQPQLPPDFVPDDLSTLEEEPAPDSPPSPSSSSLPTTTAPAPDPEHPSNPTASPPPSPDHSRIASIHNNALAYRHASLVYLYRTVLARPRAHPTVQTHARRALAHCVATVRHRGPMSALLWPLFVAACEAVTPRDRALAERAFVEVERRQGMRNIERAWGIVGEVWRRGDFLFAEREREGVGGGAGGGCGVDVGFGFGEVDGDHGLVVEGGEEMWRGVCREMGVSIVFG